LGTARKKVNRLVHGHVEDVGDVHALEMDFEGFAVVAAAVAGFAGDIDGRQEVHFDFDQAVALAFLATAALDVEAEAAGLVAADFGRGQFGEEIADLVEHAGVGGRIAARGAANGGLVNDDDLVQGFEAANEPVPARAVPWSRRTCGKGRGAKCHPPACSCPSRSRRSRRQRAQRECGR
jgi:hypothetical protein